jgi:hypothetical protein
MTKEEMSNFLKSIGGLKYGYYSNSSPVSDPHMFDIGPGWYKLVKELIEDLIELGWDRSVSQVKEKFGSLRFYIPSGSDEMHDRINKAEDDSYFICEVTGLPGEVRPDLGWWRTLCDEEYKKAKGIR